MTCIPIQLLCSLCFVPSPSFINSCWPKKSIDYDHIPSSITEVFDWCLFCLCTERPSYAPPPPPAPTTVSAPKFSKRSLLWWPRGRTSSLNSLGFLLHVQTKVLSVNFVFLLQRRVCCALPSSCSPPTLPVIPSLLQGSLNTGPCLIIQSISCTWCL